MSLFRGFFTAFLSWWGVLLVGTLDTTVVFFMPFGVDAVVIVLAARDPQLFWIYPLLATCGSLAGAAITFWIGRKIGEGGLERFVQTRRLESVRRRVSTKGAFAIAIPALLPPPFPLTPFVLTSGAVGVDPLRFFVTFGIVRLFRFSIGAALARAYGSGILSMLDSGVVRVVVTAFIVLAVAGTIASGILLWHRAHPSPARA
jgi:membrane protein YqaA with SNARE-associated domain